jgi:enoyl-CoA hydratase/carnithine racemase
VKEIILDAPGKNALSSDLIQRVRTALREADGQPVLLTGAGDAFSAGLNLKEVRAFTLDSAREFLVQLDALIVDLYHYPGPTVALVNGHAIAGGCVATLACDHRVMKSGSGARIGLNETAIGLPLPPIVARLAKARVPQRHREQVVLGALLYDADTALELGLVDEIADKASAVAGERLASLAKHPRAAYAANKRMLRLGDLECTAEEIDVFAQQGLPLWVSPETKRIVESLLSPRA